jgi:uncharacterized membrane protein YoaK (UPF0700 family)/anti-anti-sigma regulatory factor
VFLSAAHSFKQQARLAVTLAWVAGYTNIVALLACGTVTSHMTGAASNLGRGLAERDWSLAGFEVFLLGAFVCGAVLAGVATEVGRRRGWQSIYVLPMALEAVLLAAFAVGVELSMAAASTGGPSDGSSVGTSVGEGTDAKDWTIATYALVACAAAAMGLQNATITRISSGVVRTTHVTGVLTDIGLELVQAAETAWDAVRKRRRARGDADPRTIATPALAALRVDPHARRLALLASIVASFVLGAGLGVLVFERVSSQWAMFPPVLFLAWIIAQDLRKPIAEIEPSELVARAGLDLPDWLGVYHLANDGTHGIVSLGEHGAKQSAAVQRLPDLVAWLELLPEHVRVIVLDLTDVAALEEDAGLQLRAAILALREQGRKLIIAGVTNEQYRQLRKAGAGDVLDAASVCPDLELAIARALA